MAQVIDYYRAEAGGSSTMYYYQQPDNTSQATRIYTGEVIHLYENYLSTMVDTMYRMKAPDGWIQWYHVQNIQAVYRTVADACTPPSAVSVDVKNKTLVIAGGAGGDLNQWTGFGVSFRSRSINSSAWGAWSADTVVTQRSVAVSADSGTVRQYRVRTLGSAGSAYYSAYTVCATLLSGNTAAGVPVILLPLSGADTCSGVISVKMNCPPEPDGDTMTLQRSVDNGAWTDVKTISGAGATAYDRLNSQAGAHTLRYRLVDANGESGGEDSILFTCSPVVWKRAIRPGDVIANREISFVQDVHELLERVNKLRAFYGKPLIDLPGMPGCAADWAEQLQAMQEALDECRVDLGCDPYGFDTPSGWPKAAQINLLRTAVENT